MPNRSESKQVEKFQRALFGHLARRAQEDDTKRDMLSQLLLPAARERLSRIQLVRPQRADQITGLLARMAQSGQIRGRVTEEQLVDVLNQVEAMEQGGKGGGSSAQQSKIVVGVLLFREAQLRSEFRFCAIVQ